MRYTTSAVFMAAPSRQSYETPEHLLDKDVTARFGRRLKVLRHERNLTQTRMATKFGLDRSFISDVERGKKASSLATLEVFALGFKVSLSDLLRGI